MGDVELGGTRGCGSGHFVTALYIAVLRQVAPSAPCAGTGSMAALKCSSPYLPAGQPRQSPAQQWENGRAVADPTSIFPAFGVLFSVMIAPEEGGIRV